MSLHVLASGALIADPQCREGAKGPFTTATIRVDGDLLVSVIGLGDAGERLLRLGKGDPVSVAGPARLTAWTASDGSERHGISVRVEQIIAAKPRPKPAVRARQRVRKSYSGRRFARNSGAPLPTDGVDDLWRDRPVP
jgi:hypothetical protein